MPGSDLVAHQVTGASGRRSGRGRCIQLKIHNPKGLKKSHGNKKGVFIQQNVQTFVKQSKVEEAINAAKEASLTPNRIKEFM